MIACFESIETSVFFVLHLPVKWLPVVKLLWWAVLEPTTNSKCKPVQSQWVLLKLESRYDVIKPLFSRAIIAGQHNVLAQKVFLEENRCNAGRCSACDVIALS